MTLRPRLAAAFVLASWAWTIALVAVPLASARAPEVRLPASVSASVYLAGGFLCHQRAGRSFHPWGVRMPVCARCFGLYASASLGAVAGLFAGVTGAHGRSRRLTAHRLLVGLALAAVPTGLIWLVEWLGLAYPPAIVRAALAVPLGATVGWIVTTAIGHEIG